MAFTQTQLDSLNDAISQGALTVKYGDKEVTYRSLKEMLQLRDLMQDELAPTNSDILTKGRRYGDFSKGLQ